MALRLASAAAGVPLLISVVWVGSLWFTALVGIAAAISSLEMSRMARGWRDRPVTFVAVGAAVALVAGAHFLADLPAPWQRALPVVAGVAAGASLTWLLMRPRSHTGASVWIATTGVALLVGGLLFHAPVLRALDQGREWVLFLLAVTFATDTCAYVVGKAVGKRSLAPSVSPAKTWEGAIAGAVGAIGASVAAVAVLDLDATLAKTLALGIILGIVGQLGDLSESKMKRNAGVKDSGWLVPGHGGILDRTDSIVFNLVVMYYFVS